MEPIIYEVSPHRIRTLSWPEATKADIERLVGAENVDALPSGGIQVRNGEDEWFTLGEGWSVVVLDDGYRMIMTPGALSTKYQRPVPVS
jgi:hypothetical protein